MQKRTNILLGFFGLVVAYVVATEALYPKFIKPLFELDQQIAAKQETLDELQFKQLEVEARKRMYRRYAERVGSMHFNRVKNDMHARLNELIARHGLTESRVDPSRRASEDRRTQLSDLTFSITAQASLPAVVGFMRDLAELPHLVRVEDVRLVPLTGRDRKTEGIDFRTTLRVLMLPQQPQLMPALRDEQFTQPERHPRHADLKYSVIAAAKPFWEYEPPRVEVAVAPPKVQEKPKVNTPAPPPPPPPPPDWRWKDRAKWELVWTGMTGAEGTMRGECMVVDSSRKKGGEERYIELGGDFNGGILVFVHQTGVLIQREHEFYAYVLGRKLDFELRGEHLGDEYPELRRAYEMIRKSHEQATAASEPAQPGAGRLAARPAGQGGSPTVLNGNAVAMEEVEPEVAPTVSLFDLSNLAGIAGDMERAGLATPSEEPSETPVQEPVRRVGNRRTITALPGGGGTPPEGAEEAKPALPVNRAPANRAPRTGRATGAGLQPPKSEANRSDKKSDDSEAGGESAASDNESGH